MSHFVFIHFKFAIQTGDMTYSGLTCLIKNVKYTCSVIRTCAFCAVHFRGQQKGKRCFTKF